MILRIPLLHGDPPPANPVLRYHLLPKSYNNIVEEMESFNLKEAAVATIVSTTSTPEVLVLKRKTNPRDPWSGHYAFPGGRREHNDASLLETCIRETYEECGIQLSPSTLVKEYPVRKAGNYLNKPVPVTAFLFELAEQPRIRLQTAEISCHEWLELGYVADRTNIIERAMSPRCPDILFPCIPATAGFVWGFTYETLMMVVADRYRLSL